MGEREGCLFCLKKRLKIEPNNFEVICFVSFFFSAFSFVSFFLLLLFWFDFLLLFLFLFSPFFSPSRILPRFLKRKSSVFCLFIYLFVRLFVHSPVISLPLSCCSFLSGVSDLAKKERMMNSMKKNLSFLYIFFLARRGNNPSLLQRSTEHLK